MICFPLLLSLLVGITMAKTGPSDHSCTMTLADGSVRFDHRALNCENVAEDDVCTVLYSNGGVNFNSTEERPEACFKKDGTDNDNVKQTAIKTCPKTCGFCCLTPQYNCKNSESPRFSCEKVSTEMCRDPKWQKIISEDCPNVCGMCQEQNCVDAVPGCSKDHMICKQIDMQSFVKQNCRKTCGYCGESPSKNSTSCGDGSKMCTKWKRQGFCESEFYSKEERSRYCGTTCGLCN